jgi:hypothetical protein
MCVDARLQAELEEAKRGAAAKDARQTIMADRVKQLQHQLKEEQAANSLLKHELQLMQAQLREPHQVSPRQQQHVGTTQKRVGSPPAAARRGVGPAGPTRPGPPATDVLPLSHSFPPAAGPAGSSHATELAVQGHAYGFTKVPHAPGQRSQCASAGQEEEGAGGAWGAPCHGEHGVGVAECALHPLPGTIHLGEGCFRRLCADGSTVTLYANGDLEQRRTDGVCAGIPLMLAIIPLVRARPNACCGADSA